MHFYSACGRRGIEIEVFASVRTYYKFSAAVPHRTCVCRGRRTHMPPACADMIRISPTAKRKSTPFRVLFLLAEMERFELSRSF